MRALVVSVGFGCLITGCAYAAGITSPRVPPELWNALGTVAPQLSTARLRWMNEDTALFEGATVPETARTSVQQLYRCNWKDIHWACAAAGEVLHIEANGMQHAIQTEELKRDLVSRIADYMYSPCFEIQREQLGTRGRARWGDYKRPITSISVIGKDLFRVFASGGLSGVSFTIEDAASDLAADCPFRLIDVGGWIVMRPNFRWSGRLVSGSAADARRST